MKFVYIICEGPSEKAFVEKVLCPHLKTIVTAELNISAISIGGVSLEKVIDYSKNLLHDSSCSLVTTFVDFCDLKPKYVQNTLFPSSSSYSNQVAFIQDDLMKTMKQLKPNDYNLDSRYLPYLSLHQYETLVFSDLDTLERYYDEVGLNANINRLRNEKRRFNNIEEINTDNKPSYRLMSAISANGTSFYDKVTDGSEILSNIGMERLLLDSPHFANWVNDIVQRLNRL